MTTPTGGPWTRHGHTIPGITIEGPDRPPIARCGGTRLCPECAYDAGKAEAQKVIADTTAPAPQPAPLTDPPDEPPTGAPNCSSCQRSRTTDDELDYNPTQVMFGGELGWYSGDDGEICGDCMTGLIRGQQ